MLVDIVIEKRFFRCREGHIWTENAFPYAFWQRYLAVFSQVNIVARVHDVSVAQSGWRQVTGHNVLITALPGYIGPMGLLKALPKTLSVLASRRGIERRVIYRVPGILAWLYSVTAGSRQSVYGAEVVGDPADTFTRAASKHPLRPLLRYFFVYLLKRQCKGAYAISYVTESALQRRYPPNKAALFTHYSSIHLCDEDFKEPIQRTWSTPVKLLCIGNLSQPYKGCDLMLDALAVLKNSGVNCQLTWIGGGSLLANMQDYASALNLDSQVQFVGNVANRNDMRQYIDNADCFVLPSRQEGLPRVLIEAMARGKFCIATDVGGVNELLPPSWVIAPHSSELLVSAITRAITLDLSSRHKLCERHYHRAMDFHDKQLQIRREALYKHLLEAPL
ncbi:glycosyltransferase [Alteromonas sediminis]|uniref:Glycosyltransferase n=1 Tax=Alteromonas sediminis TaxID=2259342 RepID=A0A3N5Y3H2_9ALTE|nr:glycosyltransferase [Alteromonas sediminis]RPJ67850.1 glycosyltransferase [Alteromonas sediminis]